MKFTKGILENVLYVGIFICVCCIVWGYVNNYVDVANMGGLKGKIGDHTYEDIVKKLKLANIVSRIALVFVFLTCAIIAVYTDNTKPFNIYLYLSFIGLLSSVGAIIWALVQYWHDSVLLLPSTVQLSFNSKLVTDVAKNLQENVILISSGLGIGLLFAGILLVI